MPIPIEGESDLSPENSEKSEKQRRLAYKLEDILSDPELALEIGNILVQIALPSLDQGGRITFGQHADLVQVYENTMNSLLTPEQKEEVDKEEEFRAWDDEIRRRRGKLPKRSIFD